MVTYSARTVNERESCPSGQTSHSSNMAPAYPYVTEVTVDSANRKQHNTAQHSTSTSGELHVNYTVASICVHIHKCGMWLHYSQRRTCEMSQLPVFIDGRTFHISEMVCNL
jgi:hypothetical protein